MTAVPTPISGATYNVISFGFGHWLNNADFNLNDGNPILAWNEAIPQTNNQIWKYTSYPSGSLGNLTAFTLQCVSTMDSEGATGGYMRVNTTDEDKIVQAGAPMSWILEQVSAGVFSILPYDPAISGSTSPSTAMVLTDPQPNVTSIKANQAQLEFNQNLKNQMWQFFPVTPTQD